ncbi:MAG: hypothetical protein ABI666_06445 [Ferruginibacter sp.]
MIKLPVLYLALLFLFSCSSCNEEKKKEQPAKNDTLALKNNSDIKFVGDSVEIAPFEIEVSLSDKAEEKLRKSKETIIVAAYFSGMPKDTTLTSLTENGEWGLGSRELELHSERSAKFEQIRFSRSLYDSVAPKSMNVLINIFSGRRSTNVNLLSCDILQDSISAVGGKKFLLKGKLIAE